MYANVILETPTSPEWDFFTYFVGQNLEKKIKVGQKVEVPFGKKYTSGYVIKLLTSTDLKNPKSINKIIYSKPLINVVQIELIRLLSEHYFAPYFDPLNLMIPNFPSSLKVDSLTKNLKSKIHKLILVSSIFEIPNILAKQDKKSKVLIYHANFPLKMRIQNYLDILDNKPDIVIGTRSAVLAPFSKIDQIEIINEEEPGFREERSPYFDTTFTADKLAKLTYAKFIVKSSTPRIETSWKIKHKQFSALLQIIKPPDIQTTIVDSKINTFPLAYSICERIRNSNQPVLIILNRVSNIGRIFCKDCEFVDFAPQTPSSCPNCGNLNLQFFNLDVKTLSDHLKKEIPEKTISIVSSNSPLTKLTDIIISTSTVFYSRLPLKFRYAIILADSFLNIPSFNASQITFGAIVKTKNLIETNGEFFIQTKNVDNFFINSASANDYIGFYSKEVKERQKLNYPPFWIFAKITIPKKESEKLIRKLESVKNTFKKPVEMIGPLESKGAPGRKGEQKYDIILKAQNRQDLEPLLLIAGKSFKIVIEPNDL